MKIAIWMTAFVLLVVPVLVMAEDSAIPAIPTDLVPCGDDTDDSACQACHLYVLVENVFEWFFGVSAVIVSIIIVVGGVRLATSGGNQQAKRDNRRLIRTAIVGFILVGSAWVLVDLLISTLANSADSASIFSSIECVEQPNE
jgi:hypothetical protein